MVKHLITFPINGHECNELIGLMDKVSAFTGILPPSETGLGPHVSFHRPVFGVSETKMKGLMASAALQMQRTRIIVGSLTHLGKEYIVMPVYATRMMAALWIEINDLITRLPAYGSGPYDGLDILHITIARHTSAVFDEAWPVIRQLAVPTLIIPVTQIALYRKENGDTMWRQTAIVPLPEE